MTSRRGWSLLLCGVASVLLRSCDGGDSGTIKVPTPTPTPTPSPTPTPTPTTAAGYVGAVYVGANNAGADGNYVASFGRKVDGTLVPLDIYRTGGMGRTPSGSPLNPLGSEDSVLAVDNSVLLVVNAGSNTLTSFRVNPDLSLTQVSNVPTSGTQPISVAERNGIVYVANADADGVFVNNADQSGNVTGFTLNHATGELIAIGGSTRSLGARPTNLEFTGDGRHLIVAALNPGNVRLMPGSDAEIASWAVDTAGMLGAAPIDTAMSTLPGNAANRNLPNAIGIEVVGLDMRDYVIAAESRTVPATGVPGTFATLQTSSMSTWLVRPDGSFEPRVQDFMLGPTTASGHWQAGWIALSPYGDVLWVTTSTGATISGYGLNYDGTFARGEPLTSGIAIDLAAANPLTGADGFIDLAVSTDGKYLYQLVGLKGRVDVYEIDTLLGYNIARRQQVTSPLLPTNNIQGIAYVAAH